LILDGETEEEQIIDRRVNTEVLLCLSAAEMGTTFPDL
jgi:hypothetical protein